MASRADCQRAIDSLAERLADVPLDLRRRHAPDRTVVVEILDLEVAHVGEMVFGELIGLACVPLPFEEPAQIRLALSSDDLVALADGVLSLSTAWASGKVRIDASVLDMVRLRVLL